MSELLNINNKIKPSKKKIDKDDIKDKDIDTINDTITELTIEDIYQKMEHKEHALELPDTYIGSIESHEEVMWVVNENYIVQPITKSNDELDKSTSSNSLNNSQNDDNEKEDTCVRMIQRKIKYVPGLYKIYDEILVNALDHVTRIDEKIRRQNLIKNGEMSETPEITLKMKFKPVKNIKVDIDQANNQISVYNDGDGIPIELHKEFNVYVPELLFSQFLTSGNYKGKNGNEINQIKIIGGKNGYGGKLTALFSTKFTIETVDANNQKKYVQTFENNLNIINPPEITDYKGLPYTKFTFQPDLKRFSLDSLTDDISDLFKKRVYDAAGWCNGINVSLNDKLIPIKDFNKYTDLYLGTKTETKRVFLKINDRWQMCITVSPDHEFQQVSMVNGIVTSKGGRHINYIADQIAKKLSDEISTKNEPIQAKTVRSNIWIFLRCVIENPNFDSQTKENMTTLVAKFGSKCDIDLEDIKKIGKCGITQRAKELSKFKDTQISKSMDGKKVVSLYDIEKLDDAEHAGDKKLADKCTLILTEGDSAKGFAQIGLKAFTPEERKFWGIFPLKGKMLNVRNAKQEQINKNDEIINIIKILGLASGVDYNIPNGLKKLRYGHVLILTDADHDGAHIKGLFINFIHKFWPSLLECNNFISTMVTPIVIVWKEHKNGRKIEKTKIIKFYSQNKYNQWKLTNNNGHGWKTRYYKGLGTSEENDAIDFFSEKKLINYLTDPITENTSGKIIKPTDDAINLAFLEDNADLRKTWLLNADLDKINEFDKTTETYSNFINHELIHFSWADTFRSIPNIADGLKPGQRKIIYFCLKHNLHDSLKVSQLCGKISDEMSYHHGEVSLEGTIVGIAQNFIGSNNINLLYPSGNFGTKYANGTNAGSSRYIYTHLEDITPFIFNLQDLPLYKYLDDDGTIIEPEWFLPIIPMILVNGSAGIGTGFSTFIPQYNPLDLTQRQRQLLNNDILTDDEPIPWYRGFTGKIQPDTKKSGGFICTANYQIFQNKIVVTELPVTGNSFESYKKFLEEIMQPQETKNKESQPHILSDLINDLSFDTSLCHVEIIFKSGGLQKILSHGIDVLEKLLKLKCRIPITNLTLFNTQQEIKKYNSVNDIIKDYFLVRLDFYQRRKEFLISKHTFDFNKISSKLRFVTEIINEKLIIYKKPKKIIINLLETHNYPKFTNKVSLKNKSNHDDITPENDDDTNDDTNDFKENYNYLLSMRIDSFSQEMLDKLTIERDKLANELEWATKTSAKEMWLFDLDKFEVEYLDWLKCWYEDKKIPIPNDLKTNKKIKMNNFARRDSSSLSLNDTESTN